MHPVVVIGDEAVCAGFRLAGAVTRSPAPGALDAEFAWALGSASLVVLSQRCADALAPTTLRAALAHEAPLVVVLPDIVEPQADARFVRRMRSALGLVA